MANARELKSRIKTVKSTAKITRTMEMVATAKSKKAFDRVNALKPYAEKLRELMGDLSNVGDFEHPILRRPEQERTIALVVITANRGLCGGFNANILRLANKRIAEIKKEGKECLLYVIGKKGIGFFNFTGVAMTETYRDLDEKVTYARTEEIAEVLVRDFGSGKIDRVEIFSNRLKGAGSTYASSESLLPLSLEGQETEKRTEVPYIFNPAPQKILGNLLPLSIKTNFFRAVIESMAAELIARRVAMKNATDAANDMKKDLTQLYNRSRQAGITQEIAEIVGGVEALK